MNSHNKQECFVLGMPFQPSRNKHSSWEWKSVNHGQKKFYNIGPRVGVFNDKKSCFSDAELITTVKRLWKHIPRGLYLKTFYARTVVS